MPIENIVNSRVILALVGYCIFACLLVLIKPSFIYDNDEKNFRKFGVGKKETLLSLEVILVLAAIASYSLACLFSSGSIFSLFEAFGKSVPPLTETTPPIVAQSTSPPPVPSPDLIQSGGGGKDFLSRHLMYDSLPSVATTSFFHQPTQPFYHKPSISFPPSKIWKSLKN
jgi:hypothetical protein